MEWDKLRVSVLCPACAGEGPCVLTPALLPGGSAWTAAYFAFRSIMVGAQCMIILRDISAALAPVTSFLLHSSHAKAPELVACLG